MTHCIIKNKTWALSNHCAFVEISDENIVTVGYLMNENDNREPSRERIASLSPFPDRIRALRYAIIFLAECASLSRNFYAMEEYIYSQATPDQTDDEIA